MPALGMAQETGTLVRWLKAEGDAVREGDALAEIQTDKATVELEARASGTLAKLLAREGEDVPVGQVITSILAPGERSAAAPAPQAAPTAPSETANGGQAPAGHSNGASNGASPLASRIAAEHGVALETLQTNGKRVQKADVIAYLAARTAEPQLAARLTPASPKARRLAQERGLELGAVQGSGPSAAVLTADVLVAAQQRPTAASAPSLVGAQAPGVAPAAVSPIWRIMAERTTQSWQEIPHFFLLRDVNASRLIAWRTHARRQNVGNVTYTDLLVKVVAETLRTHAKVNASWQGGGIIRHQDVNVGIAVATPEALVVPVIHRADHMSLAEIVTRREELVKQTLAGKQRPDDLTGATFTISNLGMYGVDAFTAIVPKPQAAILAVGRIAERVVPVQGAPAVQPMMTLSVSFDHRVVDGARGAEFLSALADLIEEPLALLA